MHIMPWWLSWLERKSHKLKVASSILAHGKNRLIFPHSPMVRISRFHREGPGSIPGVGKYGFA